MRSPRLEPHLLLISVDLISPMDSNGPHNSTPWSSVRGENPPNITSMHGWQVLAPTQGCASPWTCQPQLHPLSQWEQPSGPGAMTHLYGQPQCRTQCRLHPHPTHTPWPCKSREQGQESLDPLQPLWATPGWTAGRACRFRDHAVRCAYCLCLSGKLLTSLNPSSLIPKWEEYLLSLYRTSASTPSTAARLASLSIANSWSLLKLMSIESVMPSSHLILCHPLLLLPVSSRVGT